MKPSPQLPHLKALVMLFAACAAFAALARPAAALQAPPSRTATPPGRPVATPTPRTAPPGTTTTPPPRPVAGPTAQPSPQARPTFATPTPSPTPESNWVLVKQETVWRDWLWLLGGVLFFSVAGYMIYSAMLYNQVRANRHPANFRRLIISLVLLLSIIWFGYVFRDAFGLVMLIILLAVWLAVVLVFFLTKRKGAAPQE